MSQMQIVWSQSSTFMVGSACLPTNAESNRVGVLLSVDVHKGKATEIRINGLKQER